MGERIRIAIAGVGNCASALVQGIHFYREQRDADPIGLMHREIAGFGAGDVEVVAAFDIDARKVGRDLTEAVFAPPNCTKRFQPELPASGVCVRMGAVLDGFADHMGGYPAERRCVPAGLPEPDRPAVVKALRETGAELLLNYLPVGSEQATRFYAECALDAGVGFINNIPVFIASDPAWAQRFEARGLPLIGDDIKSQLGATITHRVLVDLFRRRGVRIDRTYQLNTGGNTDFLNMLDRSRLASKKVSKTEAVQSVAGVRLPDADIHVGPSDYVPWQRDNKVCFIRIEGRMFGEVPLEIELRLSVEDSPNSAGVAIDAIRCAKLALLRGQGGVLHAPAAYFCKHPPRQYSDDEAYRLIEAFVGDWPRRELPRRELPEVGARAWPGGGAS
jgi:myo-inositol-1-phosphate synthase